MRKFIMTVALAMGAVLSAFAQTNVETGRVFDNTSIGISAGVVTPMVQEGSLLNNLTPTVGIQFDKWFTPVFGAELEGLTAVQNPNSNPTFHQSWYAGANGLVNVSNLFAGYKGYPRRVEFLAYTGAGYGYGNYTYGYKQDEVVGDVDNVDAGFAVTPQSGVIAARHGYQVNVNLGKARAWQINFRNGVTYNIADGNYPIAYDVRRGFVNATLGVTYKFGYRNTKGQRVHNFTVVPVPYFSQKEVDDAVIAALQNRKPEVVEKEIIKETIKETVKEVIVTNEVFASPTFVKNQAVLDETSKANIERLAQKMNATNNDYCIFGYASIEGSEARNFELSQARADAVKDALVAAGVNEGRLHTVAMGPTEKFGAGEENYPKNRIVVVE